MACEKLVASKLFPSTIKYQCIMQNERIKNDRMGGSSGLVTGVALAFSNI